MSLSFSKANKEWTDLVRACLTYGRSETVRGLTTTEILGNQSVIDMRYPMVTHPDRKIGYSFMPAEAAWILSGDNRTSTIVPYAKVLAQFSDDGEFFNGAYGPPLIDQIPYIIKTLQNDLCSRQAVATIWRQKPGASKDIPCTISVQWMVRKMKMGSETQYQTKYGASGPTFNFSEMLPADERLCCFVNMRSSDIWLGWPYDVFNWSMVSGYLVAHLQKKGAPVGLGMLVLNAGSQHIYTANIEGAKNVAKRGPAEEFLYEPFNPGNFISKPDALIEHLRNVADRKWDAPTWDRTQWMREIKTHVEKKDARRTDINAELAKARLAAASRPKTDLTGLFDRLLGHGNPRPGTEEARPRGSTKRPVARSRRWAADRD